MSIFSQEKLRSLIAYQKPAKRHTIMVVDDEPTNLSLFFKLLSRDYNVIEAVNGNTALNYIKNMDHPEDIALIVSDQRMPEMTGVELFKHTSERIPETVRIIVTGYMDYDTVVNSINDAHIYKFITKPIEREEFLLTIQRAIEHYETKQQLNEYINNLEAKVATRTDALRRKNIELREAYRALKKLSVTDQLTGFYNRHFLEEYIRRDVDFSIRAYTNWLHQGPHEQPIASDLTFFMIDIDHFKAVNDKYGHTVGDKVLIQMCEIINSVFRDSDFLVRWGGEEFLAISRFVSRKNAKIIANRLKETVANNHFKIGQNNTIHCTCSTGFAHFPFIQKQPTLISWKEVINIADKALYAAKHSGRNAWVTLESNRHLVDQPAELKMGNIQPLIECGTLCSVASFSDRQTIHWPT